VVLAILSPACHSTGYASGGNDLTPARPLEICHNMAEMAPVRYLCSHLMTVGWEDGAVVANLEEISATGAVLESEVELAACTAVELRSGATYFEGEIRKAEEHDFGWRITVELSPFTPWSVERFRPQHLLDLTTLPGAAAAGTAKTT
jgi:hypothetical protein